MTSSKEEQTPSVIVQRRVTIELMGIPVSVEMGDEGSVTIAVPEMMVQVPVSEVGVFPVSHFNEKVALLRHYCEDAGF